MYIILFTLCVLFAVTCAIMIAIYFVTAGILVSYLETHPSAGNMSIDSIPDGLTSLTAHMIISWMTALPPDRNLPTQHSAPSLMALR